MPTPSRSAPADDPGLSDELTAVAAAMRLAGQAVGVADALRAQLGIVHELTRARASFVSLLDAPRSLLTVVGTRGRADDRVKAHALDEGSVGRAFTEQRIVEEDGVLAAGFARNGQPMGVVTVLGAKLRPSDAGLQALCASMAAALEVAHLGEGLRHRTEELDAATAQLKAVDKKRDEFLGWVSHELKTPLTTVKTYLAMLLRGHVGPVTAEQQRALGICDRNSDRLLRLIDDSLLVSRLSAGQMNLRDKPFGLKALLEECWAQGALAAERAQVELVPVTGGEVFVRGDREHLRESFQALLDNAVRYNVAGGQVRGRVASQGSTAQVELADTGRGMSAEKRAELFEPFGRASEVSAKRSVTGSSLARVHQVVQLHGGALAVESAPERGATFTLTLPLFAGMVDLLEPAGPSLARTGSILLVEDDDDCREGVQELLEAEGMSVTSVASAEAAVASLRTRRPALVLVDLRLREGDGRGVIAHVRATPRLSDVPVFVMSGAVTEASSFESEGPARIDGFFEKPLNLPRLLASIRAIVQQEP